MHYEKYISGGRVFAGKIVDLHHDIVELENGKQALREVIRHPGAVGILAKDGDALLFVRQYRYAVEQELLEITAGKLEPGEDPAAAALRELQEETGMQAQRMEPLGEFYASPGVYNEVIHLYFAQDMIFVGENPDENEFVTPVRMTPAEFEQLLAQGKVRDGKTVCAFALAKAKGLL